MQSGNELPSDIWNLIVSELNESNLRVMSLISHYFYALIHDSKLLKRPKWHGVNYHELSPFLEEVNHQAGMLQFYPLRNGDLAFGLKKSYCDWWNDENRARPQSEIQFSAPSWQDHRDILVLSNQVVKLSGHQNAVKQVIQHNATTL